MTVEDCLRRLADALPDGAAVTLPVSLIRSWLVQGGPAEADHNADMTVAEVATLFNRSPQTVRTWVRHGDLDAYRLHGREYRITARALEVFQQQQQAGAVSPQPQRAPLAPERPIWWPGGPPGAPNHKTCPPACASLPLHFCII